MAGHDERVVLFLFSDTGGGHRRAAEAVMEALATGAHGSFRLLMHDPLLGPDAAWPQRLIARLYGPAVRRAPWLWGAGWYVSNSRPAMAVLSRTVFGSVARTVAAQVRACAPDVIVSCHPLTGRAAVRAARGRPVVTLVTDLARVHASWREPGADLVLVPSAAAAEQVGAGRCLPVGLPVEARLRPRPRGAGWPEPAGPAAGGFVVLLAGGAEGCGGMARRAAAVLRAFADVQVVAACGRNERLRRRLSARALRAGGRLTVLGYVGNFADWLGRADVVVTKAGPAIIAEAACCGTPLLLTSHLPGQERGNADLVVRARAGRSARGVRGMLAELAAIRADDDVLAGLRAGAAALAKPDAAARAAAQIARLARTSPADRLAGASTGRKPASAVTAEPAGAMTAAAIADLARPSRADLSAAAGADGTRAGSEATEPAGPIPSAAGPAGVAVTVTFEPRSGRAVASPAR
jgi:1,2-diacylglycerol 3-beta-galactosyltransferase